MRRSAVVLLLAACSSTPPKPDEVIPLTCDTDIAQYCAKFPCDQTLTAAEEDKRLCPALLSACGDYEIVTTGGIDASQAYFYQHGHLVAISFFAITGSGCAAGPAMFDGPQCYALPPPPMLPACTAIR